MASPQAMNSPHLRPAAKATDLPGNFRDQENHGRDLENRGLAKRTADLTKGMISLPKKRRT
jgi:hypothetical protein